jgi:putative oxidoreductase
MNGAFALGRVALVAIFVFSGATKLLDIPGSGEEIRSKFTIPPMLNDATSQIEAAVGMPTSQLIAIAVALLAIICGLLIAFNVLTRTAAVVLLIFAAVTTFYYYDFWNMSGAERSNSLVHALQNLSIMGALLMLAAWPRRFAGERAEGL